MNMALLFLKRLAVIEAPNRPQHNHISRMDQYILIAALRWWFQVSESAVASEGQSADQKGSRPLCILSARQITKVTRRSYIDILQTRTGNGLTGDFRFITCCAQIVHWRTTALQLAVRR